MPNEWAIITPVEQKEIEKQGLSFLDNNKIYCDECNKVLVQVITVKDSDEVNAIRVVCPCGESSFWRKIKGKIYLQAEFGYYVNESITDIKNDIIYSTLVIKKDK